jgi:hypothetical protein
MAADGLIMYVSLWGKCELTLHKWKRVYDYRTPAEHATIFTVCIPRCLDMETKSTTIPINICFPYRFKTLLVTVETSYTQNEWCVQTLFLILLHYMALYPEQWTTVNYSPFACHLLRLQTSVIQLVESGALHQKTAVITFSAAGTKHTNICTALSNFVLVCKQMPLLEYDTEAKCQVATQTDEDSGNMTWPWAQGGLQYFSSFN